MMREWTEECGDQSGLGGSPGVPEPLLALTIHQPWATAVTDLGKRIENRSWPPPRTAVGGWLAIHAGLAFDESGADWVASRTGRMTTKTSVPRGAIVALARVKGAVRRSSDMWFSGPYGWQLDEVIPVEPLPCRGRQRLWKVPPEIRATLADYLKSQTTNQIVD